MVDFKELKDEDLKQVNGGTNINYGSYSVVEHGIYKDADCYWYVVGQNAALPDYVDTLSKHSYGVNRDFEELFSNACPISMISGYTYTGKTCTPTEFRNAKKPSDLGF